MSRPAFEAVVVGASAGAVEALSTVLPALPQGYPCPVMVVVHVPPDRDSVLAAVLRSKCRVAVREAEDKEPLAAGIVYVAPPDYHLLVERDRSLSLSADEPVLYSRPSIDVLFESAADVFGPALLGVVLSGANADGAQGARAVEEAGGTVIVQCPKTAQASTMPAAALSACERAQALSLSEIAEFLVEKSRVA